MTRAARNRRTGLLLSCVIVAMIGLTAASVPLYRLFCQVTGFGGTTQMADAPPPAVGDRVVEIRFNADVDKRLPWSFQPAQRQMKLRVGEVGLAFYRARNVSRRDITGTAVFNVTPQKVGIYFNKVEQQTLGPGKTVEMPVTFFVDPAIVEDHNLDDVRTVTLSYTFFPATEEVDGEEEVPSGRLDGPTLGKTTQEASLR